MVLNSTVTVRALVRLQHWISEGFAFTAQINSLRYQKVEGTFYLFPRGRHTRRFHIFGLVQILCQTPLLMQPFHLSELGTSTGSTLASYPLRLGLCFFLVSNWGSSICEVRRHRWKMVHKLKKEIILKQLNNLRRRSNQILIAQKKKKESKICSVCLTGRYFQPGNGHHFKYSEVCEQSTQLRREIYE